MQDDTSLTSKISPDSIPQHIAIIMDGNGRWATKQGLPRLLGHQAGAENCRTITRFCAQYGIKYLTLYAFSTENWKRPALEVNGLFEVMGNFISRYAEEMNQERIKLLHIGDFNKLPETLQNKLQSAINLTRDNTGLNLVIALNYGGRFEIINAVQRIIRDSIPPEKITDELFNQYLYTSDIPYPDLIIRTGGELRISNFLLWQGAYSEYYFTPTLWPDLEQNEISKAIENYQKRKRRFGGL